MAPLTADLMRKINDLIAADNPRESAIPKDGLSYFSADESQVKARQVRSGHTTSIGEILRSLDSHELTFVAALVQYGHPHGSLEEHSTFEDAWDDAQEFVNTTQRDHVVSYLMGKPLSRYLPQGLTRAGVD
ncbi:Uncharacterised protein [Burkholderia pseudomallei]|nr:Uncharacterised protein [Burkholderia pseudomallei]CAJ6837019.1 Uncharacterised protein [Burkholderia pseudomallei]CAJ9987649.1 Uncharacterised protein [Burkholderia pseudomallei]